VQSLVLLERWKDALEQADALKADLPSHPQKAEIDYARGRALQGLARFDEALAAYQAVIDARKNGDLAARAQFMRGETYFHNKNYDEARREFFKVDALFNAPTWQAAALLEAGKVYERLDQWDAAAEIYKKLREKFPGDPNAATAAQRLEDIRKRGDAPRGDRPAPADQAP
jgi:TolA-binding protein